MYFIGCTEREFRLKYAAVKNAPALTSNEQTFFLNWLIKGFHDPKFKVVYSAVIQIVSTLMPLKYVLHRLYWTRIQTKICSSQKCTSSDIQWANFFLNWLIKGFHVPKFKVVYSA